MHEDDFRDVTGESDVEPMLSCNQLKVGVMITIDFGTHLVAIRWRSKGTQLFRQQCCRVIYTVTSQA